MKLSKKSLAEFFARRQKTVLIIFYGGMYVGENSSHGASVELFAWGEQPRHRAQCSLFCQRSLLLWQAVKTPIREFLFIVLCGF